MFKLVNGRYQVKCDGFGCDTVNYTGQRSFHQARNVSKEDNWEHRRLTGGSWLNFCPRCAEDAYNDRDNAGLYFFKKSASE
jgi:hypothetical protein